MLDVDDVYEDFQYIVEKVKPQRICFGSGLSRAFGAVGKGLSPYQKRYVSEVNVKVSPATYSYEHLVSGVSRLSNRVRSNRGVPGLANGTPRWTSKTYMRIPSPTRYTVEPFLKTCKKGFVPFTYKIRHPPPKKFNTPGPGTYDMDVARCRRTKTQYNFGRPECIPAVEVECNPSPSIKCDRCGDICKNDYWHKDYFKYLCHLCMEEEKALKGEEFTMKQLKQYEKIRICSYKHSHEGVAAYKHLMPKILLKRRDRRENYLNLYISSFG
ncbi:hypothetical protein FQA39_LY04161 [Lamprigera yunnana]|nr:hypothetical protein FQA39_LY04161 [Lamprigera yunnana]